MGCKKLPFIIAGLGYFPADMLSLSILETCSDKKEILYGFYNLFGNECYLENGSIIYNAEINWECETLCRKNIPRLLFDSNRSLINFIISSIDADYYVYITMDSSKIKCYSCYGTTFSPHPMVIYGYDKGKESFYIADFTDGSKYKKQEVTFMELIDANSSIIKQMEILDALSGTNEWILDIELVKHLKNYDMKIDIDYIGYSIKLFLEGRGLRGNKKSLHNRLQPQLTSDKNGNTKYYEAGISEEMFGINVFSGILNHINQCIVSDRYLFNFRHSYLIYMYYELFLQKLNILENECLIEGIRYIFDESEQHRAQLKSAIAKSLKYVHNSDKKQLIGVVEILKKEIDYIINLNKIILGKCGTASCAKNSYG